MRLVRCDGCGRHIRVEETQCPFCGEAHAVTKTVEPSFLRVSRAAVFAGAAVVGGCWTSSQPQEPQPSKVTFSEPPPGTETTPVDEGTGAISGFVADNDTQLGRPNVTVAVYRGRDEGQGPLATAQTDANGRYVIPKLPAGTYTVVVLVDNAQHRRQVTVRAGTTASTQIYVQQPRPVRVPDPIAAPYGAPPSRRRVV